MTSYPPATPVDGGEVAQHPEALHPVPNPTATPAPTPPPAATEFKPAGPSRSLSNIFLAVAMMIFGGALGAIGTQLFSKGSEKEEKKEEKPADGDKNSVTFAADKLTAAGIVLETMAPKPLVSRTWRTGRIAVHDDKIAHIFPPAEGIVREVPVHYGQSVAAGTVLAVIDSRELGQAKLEAHKARIALAAEREVTERTRVTMRNATELLQLLAAETDLAEIQKQLTNKPIGDWRQQLLGAYSRRNQLTKQLATQQASSGAVSESTFRKLQSETESAVATYTSLMEELKFQVKNQVRQAELKLKEAETLYDVANAKLMLFGLTPDQIAKLDPIAEGATMSYLPVKAPFAGTVVEKHAVLSERVGTTFQMFMLTDLSKVWVQADLYEADLPLVRGLTGKPVMFRSTVAGIPERPATVAYTGDLIDKASRTMTLTAEAPNADRLLKPGLFVEVGFDTGVTKDVIQVPVTAVFRHENRPFVFVASGEETFKKVDVTLGHSSEDFVEIASGLKAGDRVVVRGGFVLKSELLKDLMVGE